MACTQCSTVGRSASGPEPTFRHVAANGGFEPDTAIVILRCERSQHKKCGMRENRHAVARRKKQSFTHVAALC